MLKYLHIQNYRLLEDFKMEGLGQVNLIAGKNNTGKTAVLEALRILESRGDISVLSNIIFERGELERNSRESYSSLFSRSFLGENNITLKIETSEKKSGKKLSIIQDFELFKFPLYRKVFENKLATTNEYSVPPPIGLNKNELLPPPTDGTFPNDKVIYIPFFHDKISISNFWKKIVLTPKEDEVHEIMRIIEPNLIRLDIVDEGAKVKLDGESQPIALKNLGEGANRLLVIALALVSAKNKLLLIDELESGLHYSVQEQLWEIIFEYAKKWDIQVFATTHSMDTVKSFYYIARQEKYKNMGIFYRLQKSRKGAIEAILYKESDLELALEANLEPRG